MPPKLKLKKSKSKGGKRKKGKGKKKKKEKKEIVAPPLHLLTELYNQLREKLYDFKSTQTRARKKRLEGWYMTREMLNLKHDNDVYHDYLKEKMEDVQNLIQDITVQLEKERAEVERLIKERMSDYDKRLGEMKYRMMKGETELAELRLKLLEYEPLMKKLGGLLEHLKELQALIPSAELDANVKTRHLKNQYLNERAKLHNHLESELYLLITTCRAHLMPILADHMNVMELENRCNRWDLSRLDNANEKMNRQKELLLEKRNRLNMEKPYLSVEWAFNRLAQCEVKRKEAIEQRRHPKLALPPVAECDLSIAFRKYLNKRLIEERIKQKKAAILQKKRIERLKALALEREKAKALAEKLRREQIEAGLIEEEGEEEEEEELDDEDLEYYEDELGNIITAPAGRMRQHIALMENIPLEDIKVEEEEEEEESSSESGGDDDHAEPDVDDLSELIDDDDLNIDLDLDISGSGSESGSEDDDDKDSDSDSDKDDDKKGAKGGAKPKGGKKAKGGKKKGKKK